MLTGGDCLLRPDLFELISHAVSLGIPVALSPSVTPLLTPRMIRRIAASGVKAVSISLDGACAATHDAVRGISGHFDMTVQAISALAAAGLTVQANTTVMRTNVDELAELAALLPRAGARIWEVFFLVHVGRGVTSGAITAGEHEQVCHFLDEAAQHDLVVRTVEAPFVGLWPTADQGNPCPRARSTSGCPNGYGICPGRPIRRPGAHCGDARRERHRVHRLRRRGLARRISADLVGQRPQPPIGRQRPRRSATGRHPWTKFRGRCGRCEYADLCGGSRARAYAATGDPLGDDPACPHQPVTR